MEVFYIKYITIFNLGSMDTEILLFILRDRLTFLHSIKQLWIINNILALFQNEGSGDDDDWADFGGFEVKFSLKTCQMYPVTSFHGHFVRFMLHVVHMSNQVKINCHICS